MVEAFTNELIANLLPADGGKNAYRQNKIYDDRERFSEISVTFQNDFFFLPFWTMHFPFVI